MGDKLIMSQKELLRKSVLDQVIMNRLSYTDAAKKLSVSRKTVGRSLKRYKAEGDKGLVHKSRGKPSGRAKGTDLKEKVIALYREKYEGFGPTLFSEKLSENEKIELSSETVRLWLKEVGLWLPHRHRKQHRSRRARKERFGEMLQLDGSIHPWFDGIDQKQCLMNLVDDATGKTLSLMDYGETTRSAFALLKWWITEAGIPLSIYVDLKSLYVSPKSLKQKIKEGEELIEPEWLTHFSRACDALGIQIIKAYSPQAKGRVERNHAVYQDRFVKELKLEGVTDIDGANRLLSSGFINKLNEKFSKPAQLDEDAHVPLSAHDDLNQVLCWEYERQVGNDWVVRFEGKYYQIEGSSKPMVQPKQKIKVKRHLDESISLCSKKEKLMFRELAGKPEKEKIRKQKITSRQLSENARKNKHKTPWGAYNPDWLKPKQSTRSARV